MLSFHFFERRMADHVTHMQKKSNQYPEKNADAGNMIFYIELNGAD